MVHFSSYLKYKVEIVITIYIRMKNLDKVCIYNCNHYKTQRHNMDQFRGIKGHDSRPHNYLHRIDLSTSHGWVFSCTCK